MFEQLYSLNDFAFMRRRPDLAGIRKPGAVIAGTNPSTTLYINDSVRSRESCGRSSVPQVVKKPVMFHGLLRWHPRKAAQTLGVVVVLLILLTQLFLPIHTNSQVRCSNAISNPGVGVLPLRRNTLVPQKSEYREKLVGFELKSSVHESQAAHKSVNTTQDERPPQIQHSLFKSQLQMVSSDPSTIHLWPWPESQEVLNKCKTEDFYRLGKLPTISVIVTYIDRENISTLLHTVHSLFQNTPHDVMHEVILIGDNSHRDDLTGVLDVYVASVFPGKVKIYRSNYTMGLIQGRLKGVSIATGEVVVLMDSHMEVQPGWIEPLLFEIKSNPKTLAASVLDWMTKTTDGRWEYKHAGAFWKTYVDLDMVFGFQQMSDVEIKSRKSATQAIESPVTVGGMFAMKRDWFEEIGSYDEGMELWGGENIDLAVRVWLFGGRVINTPCSRVAHLEYLHNRDYRQGWDKIIHRNYKRFALVWMDEYIKYFYEYFPHMVEVDAGNITSRRALKKKCGHNFQWFLNNVFPELGLPEEHGLAYGGVEHLHTFMCLDTKWGFDVHLSSCHNSLGTRNFFWNRQQELRFPMHIYIPTFDGTHWKLHRNEYTSRYNMPVLSKFLHWKDGHIYEKIRKLCLDIKTRQVILSKCDINSKTQKWRFKHYSKDYDKVMGEFPIQNFINNTAKTEPAGVVLDDRV